MNRLMWVLLLLAIVGGALHYKNAPSQSAAGAPLQIDAKGKPLVELYATSWCGYCQAMREYFDANGIHYTEYDIEKDAAAARRHADLGGRGVPLTHIGKQVVVYGYAPDEVAAVLN